MKRKMVSIDDIKIREEYANSVPNADKLNKCRKHWIEHHEPDRELIVNNQGCLIDGYIQYLIYKEYGVEKVEVAYSNKIHKKEKVHVKRELPYYKNHMTTYIYGFHETDKTKKERVWRVPNAWEHWENDILPGDIIVVNTCYGRKEIVVTKIKWLNKAPFNSRIRTVVCKTKKQYMGGAVQC